MDTAERTPTTSATTVYDGFISYSHAADGLLAPRLQAALQRFAKPWWKRRSVRVFRDESSLSANPHLWSSITEGLDRSGWFVLLLSPDAARSEWVNQELDYWTTHKDPTRILPVVTDGEFGWNDGDVTGNAVPDALRGVFGEEPRWVDLRFARDEDQLDLKNPRFSSAVADIASAIRGIPKDELESEEVKQHRRTIRTASAAGVLVLILGIASAVAAIQATTNANKAQGSALLAAARNVSRSDMDLALLLTLQAAEHLGSSGSVEGELHNIFMVGTAVRPLSAPGTAHAKSFAVAERPGRAEVAVTAAGNQVSLIATDTGELVAMFGSALEEFSASVPAIAFDASGGRLAAINTQGVVRVWDVETGETLTEISTGEGATGRVIFGPDETALITSIHTRTVWDIETREVVWQNSDRVDSIGGVDISYDREGRWLAWTSRETGVVTIADINSGAEIWTISLPGAVAAQFHPNADIVAVKSQNDGARFFDLTGDQPRQVLAIPGGAPTAIAFNDEGNLFAVGGDTGVEVYASVQPDDPLIGWEQVAFLPTGASFGFSFDFLSDGETLAIGHKQGAGIYSLEITGETARSELDSFVWTIEAVPGTALVYSSHPPIVGRNAIYINDLDAGSSRLVSEGELTAPGWAVARSVSADRAVAYLPGEDMVAIVDPRTSSVITELEHPGEAAPWVIDVTQDGAAVVAGLAQSSEIVLWDTASGELTQRLTVDGIGDVRSVRFSPTTDIIAVGGDGGLVLVDLSSPTEVVRLPAEGSLLNVDFSPDGTTLAAADDTFGFLYIYDVSSRTRTREISVPGALDPAFTSDGSQLILGGAQSGVIAFDTNSWERRWTIPRENLPGVVLTLDVAEDRLVFSSFSGEVYGATLDFDELLEIARSRLNRGFEPTECVQYRIDPCPTLDEMRDG